MQKFALEGCVKVLQLVPSLLIGVALLKGADAEVGVVHTDALLGEVADLPLGVPTIRPRTCFPTTGNGSPSVRTGARPSARTTSRTSWSACCGRPSSCPCRPVTSGVVLTSPAASAVLCRTSGYDNGTTTTGCPAWWILPSAAWFP